LPCDVATLEGDGKAGWAKHAFRGDLAANPDKNPHSPSTSPELTSRLPNNPY